jgi:vitamin B12/bleomycin/antimicrobial peptide transport system ATP-binding/permease protein
MKYLSLAVGLFAALALVFGARSGDATVIGLGVAAAICAATTYRSHAISSFLKIFVAIFGIETVAFGAAYLLGKTDYWPEAYRAYLIPESLPLTIAMFGILVYAVAQIPVIKTMTRIADLYYDNDEIGRARLLPGFEYQALERRIAVAMVVFLVVVNQAQVAINVRLSFFSRDWFNAIQDRRADDFWQLLLWVFTPWAFIYVASAVIEFVVQSMLIIRWRRWLTNYYVTRWQSSGTHYRMSLADTGADNPDQRIAEDVNRFIAGGTSSSASSYGIYSYSILLISTLSSLVSFSIILWTLSGNYDVPIINAPVPGFLFWVALIYAVVGTLVTHLIGQPLVRLYFARQRYEADFRFSLVRLREYAEQIALLRGEPTERANLRDRFGAVIGNYIDIVRRRKWLLFFTNMYGQISPIIPYVFTAPFYFAGKIQLGIMTQTASAFGRVESALTFFVNYYVELADFKSVLDRLTSFENAIERGLVLGTAPPRIDIAEGQTDGLKIENLNLKLPQGTTIVTVPSLSLRSGETTLLTGPSGSGKSTLFRALAGIWPFGEGRVSMPAGKSLMLLPQRPYIPVGTLRGAIAYPAEPNAYDDGTIKQALIATRLPHLIARLDEEAHWAQVLSLGEQQRVAIARALLAKPDWLFLDEATAALDEDLEEDVYRLLAERLTKTTIISIGHRSTLRAFHKRRIDLRPVPGGGFAPADAREAVPA